MDKGKKIIELRKNGKSYDDICKILKCSKSTVSYHCKKHNLTDIGLGSEKIEDKIKNEIKEYYKSHTIEETAKKFNVSTSSVKIFSDKKRIILSKEERRKRNIEKVIRRRQKLKQIAIEYKGGKCEKCGYDKNIPWVYDFHHVEPGEKDFKISTYSGSEKKMKEELDKCIMLCSNCHREIHYQEYLE